MSSLFLRILLLPFFREEKLVFDAAASFEYVWVFRGIVAFADYRYGAEFKFLRESGLASPLDVRAVIGGSVVFAAEDVNGVEAFRGAGGAGEL